MLEKIGLERRGERSFLHPMYAAAGPLAWFEIERDAWLREHADIGERYELRTSGRAG